MQFVQMQLSDTTGAIIPFGKCAVYISGTSTLAAIYDINGNLTSNPTTADTNAQVGFAASGVFDFAPQFANGTSAGPTIKKQALTGPMTPQMFGAVGDGVTNDSAAFVAAIAFLKAVAVNADSGIHKASPRLFVPAGHYYLGTTTLDITHSILIEGDGGGLRQGNTGAMATKLRWAANTTGIRVQAYNTSGASTVGGSTWDGSFTTLRYLNLYGGYASGVTAEGEYHGVHMKAPIIAEHVAVEWFQGDGFHAITTSGSGLGTSEGYSNGSRLDNCSAAVCRTGLLIEGADANVWSTLGFTAHYNRACGIDDQSFLGNLHLMPHTNGNGISGDNKGTAGFPCYMVSNGGNRYVPVQGQETAASTTAPSGTADTSVWLYIGAGGVNAGLGIIAWASGISLRCGAPYRTNNNNAPNRFVMPYEESGQGYSQFVYPTSIDGGIHGPGDPKGTGLYKHVVGGTSPGEQWNGCLRLTGTNPSFGGPAGAEILVQSGHACFWGVDRNGGVRIPIDIDGSAVNLQVNDANIVVVSANGANSTGNLTSTSASGGVGYATGAGGAATQATSKSTGVSLNKTCGQITMNGAALAANTVVSFTLTNTAIAATDIIKVVIASGATAGAYLVMADQISAGSCRISVRNVSAGSLSEAIVLNFAVIKAVAA